jgi:hypothetical protein
MRAAFVKTAPLRATQRHLPITGRRGMRSGIDDGDGKTRPTFAFVIESIDSDDALTVRPVLPLASTRRRNLTLHNLAQRCGPFYSDSGATHSLNFLTDRDTA